MTTRQMVAGVLVGLCALAGRALAVEETVQRVENATEVLGQVLEVPEQGIPPLLLRDAQGVAIVPSVIKVGFVVGGRFGKGVVLVREEGGGWSPPLLIQLAGGSLGWQIGAQSTDVVLVFKSKKGVENLLQGKITVGADAAAAAGPVGREVSAATDAQLKAEIYSYSRSRGLFAGVSLDGSVLQPDLDANEAYYATEKLDLRRVVEGKVKVPPSGANLQALLAKHTPEGTR